MTHSKNITMLETIIKADSGDAVSYETEEGEIIGHPLLKTDEIAIQRAVANKGAKIIEHPHNEMEILVVITGRMIVKFGSMEKELTAGEVAYVPPDTMHHVIAIEETDMIGITIPASEDYPNAP